MKRNYGIDFLRIILMFMVVILHILGYGGVLSATSKLSVNYGASWLIETFAYCAVNCYALISGYVYISSKYKISSFLQIWLQAFVYSIGIAICMWVLKLETFSLKSLISYCFPVSTSKYWYLSAYLGLFVLIPFLNAAINSLSEAQIKPYLLLMFFVFSILPTIIRKDIFSVNLGYSTFWLAFMYVLGACIRKFGWWDNVASRNALLIYICCVLASWGLKIGCEGITNWFLGEPKTGFNLISYTSPTMVIAAISLFFTFKNITISPKLTRFISAFSPAAFGVYLIHEHQYIKQLYISTKFTFFADFSTPIMIIGVLVSAFCIFAVCLLIDWIRHRVFVKICVKKHLEMLEDKYICHKLTITE